jgi:hypothetical protein
LWRMRQPFLGGFTSMGLGHWGSSTQFTLNKLGLKIYIKTCIKHH